MIALETKINARHEELRQEINVFQERITSNEVGRAEFEERVTYAVEARLEDVSSMVEQQTRILREDLSRNIESTRQDVEATRRDLEANRQDFETQLAALKLEAAAWPTARTREVTRVPTARPLTPPERHRSEPPVCCWCGRLGHLQKYCRQTLPEEMDQDPRTRRRLSEPSTTLPRFTVKVLDEWAKGRLTADGWIQEKTCRVNIRHRSVCDCRQTRHRSGAA
jgi:hypothetical protein